MAKMIQLKNSNNEKIYPRGIVDVLLNEPLQASNSPNTLVETTLLKKYTNYDIIACRVSLGKNGTEGIWCLLFPKLSQPLQEQFSTRIYSDNYFYGGKIILFNNTKVAFTIQHQSGWSYNAIYLNEVVGIKIT
jgi:hypothetical protein